MKPVSSDLMEAFVRAAAKRLRGDWVIIGGAVLPLVGMTMRVTVDIDIAGPADANQSDTIKLMEIAENLGLPVEAINQAGAFFLRKVRGWEKSLVEVHREEQCRILRPDVNLFIELKAARLSKSDLADCLHFLEYARKINERVDLKRLTAKLEEMSKDASDPREARLRELLAALHA